MMKAKSAAGFVSLAAAVHALLAQTAPPAIVTIDIENIVEYEGDVADVSKLATITSKITGATANNFYPVLWVGEGTWTRRGNQLFRSPNPTPGRAIADSSGAYFFDWVFDLAQLDGTAIGTLMAVGTGGAPKPPGAPFAHSSGQHGGDRRYRRFPGSSRAGGPGGNTVSPRTASMSEDPALRRVPGGGIRRYAFHLIPMFRPEVVTTPSGPAVVHASDFSPITQANPAHSGEILSVFAGGPGPTKPGVDPGQPSPASPLQPREFAGRGSSQR